MLVTTCAALALVAGCLGTAEAADARSGPHVRARQTWYAYVDRGERLDVSFTKVVDAVGVPAHDLVVTVRGPGGVTARCRVADAAPVRGGCRWDGMRVDVPGIWAVGVDVPGAGCPVVGRCSGRDTYEWALAVRRGAEKVPGRVWTERYEMSQAVDEPPVDLSFWYQSEYGYTYQAKFLGYHGGDSAIAADNLGVVNDFTCTPAYTSADRLPAADGWCGGVFKVFFEPPADDLPARAVRWDGVVDWVRPAQDAAPMIANGRFEPVSGGGGTLTFELAGYSGALVVGVDGRSFPVTKRAGLVEVFFTAADELPTSGPLVFEVAVERVAEIHFVSADVEVRAGIDVTRLNGAGGGERTVHWDDRSLDAAGRCESTPVPDGRSGADSTGGVHGWGVGACGSVAEMDGRGWGDGRVIDDWAYIPVRVTHTVVAP